MEFERNEIMCESISIILLAFLLFPFTFFFISSFVVHIIGFFFLREFQQAKFSGKEAILSGKSSR